MSTGGRPGVVAALARVCVAACFLAVSCRAVAQDVIGARSIRFRTFTTTDGLSQATARAIAQDRDGFIWVGTQDGLNRFDGYEFRVYKHDRNDPWSLSQNHVWALLADPDGSLWIGTQAGGLNHYDPALDRFSVVAPADSASSSASQFVPSLLRDRDGRIWAANGSGRLQWVDREHARLVDTPLGEQTSLRMVRAMLQARDGSVWLGTHEGLFRTDSAATSLAEVRVAAEPLDVYALAQTPNGEIWAGTGQEGLYRIGANGEAIAHYRHGTGDGGHDLPDDEVHALLANADGSIWIGGNIRGLALLDPAGGRMTRFENDPTRPDTIAANRVAALLHERNGLLVAGTWSNGISIHDPRTRALALIDRIAAPGGAEEVQGSAVHADDDGTLWLGNGSGSGLYHIDLAGQVLHHYVHDPSHPESLAHDFVYYVTRTRDGSLWVPTLGGGLDRLRADGSGFEHLRHDPADPASLASDRVLFVADDSEGTLWVATIDAGLDERCAGCTGFRHHRHVADDPASAAGDAVSSVRELRNGELWVSYRTEGLDRFDRARGRFEHFRSRAGDPASLSSDSVTTLAEDTQGTLWLGTQGGGLVHRVIGPGGKTQFETIDSRDGLAADAIGAIFETSPGTLWASTTVGLSRIERAGADVRIVNFGGHDGAQARGYWINSASRMADGRLVFGGLEGISIVDPHAIAAPPRPHPLMTALLLRNVPVAPRWLDPNSPIIDSIWRSGRVVLAHEQDNVTFEFSALEFSDPESVRYAYRLDGHGEQWIETDASRRLATWTDLPPGTYQLQLRARQQGQPWVESATPIELRVLPPPWASPTAYALYALATAFTLLMVFLLARGALRRRYAVQEAMRHSAERLKLALWGSGAELWDVDLRSGRMVRENRLAHLAANTEAADLTLAAYTPFVHPDDLPGFDRALREHLRGNAPAFECSYRTLNLEHEWVWVLTRGRAQRDDARAVRISGTTHDINDLKSAEEALRALNEELESRVDQRTADLSAANDELRKALDSLKLAQRQLIDAEKLASLGGMVAGIAHEINTPLGISVTAASHLHEEARRLSRLIAGGDLTRSALQRFEKAAREGTDIVLRNLQRADRLVRSFKQVAVDQSSEERRVVDLGKNLGEIATTLGPSLKSAGCRIELNCPQLIILETAPGALYQVVANLVMNSLTHGFAEGSAGLIRIDARREDGAVHIDYRDNGRGMDEAVRSRVFEPFFTTRRGQGGSGLGMHIAYNLVVQTLRGNIDCVSAPGQGVLFRIVLPATAGSAAAATSERKAVAPCDEATGEGMRDAEKRSESACEGTEQETAGGHGPV
jgi:ligand-binding sensor domain-containing protein/signal transduction histidine kinase